MSKRALVDYLDGVRPERVWQHHLAGHTNDGNLIIDTHDQDVIDPVWSLLAAAYQRVGSAPTLLERDFNLREGLHPKEDTLPIRFLDKPIPDGPAKGTTIDIQKLVRDYYKEKGWDC